MNTFYIRIWLNKIKYKIKGYFVRNDSDIDPAYPEALKFIKGKTFITYNQLQKSLNIGYARTGRIIDLLEENHKIGEKTEDREKRKVLI